MKFKFYMPAKVIAGAIIESAETLKSFGKKPLIVCGKSSAKACGAIDDIEAIFGKSAIYNKIEPNPSVTTVKNGAQFAKEIGADFIIGIGGGSPLDAAKMIAVWAKCEAPIEDVSGAERLPLVLIPTTIGTGSEVTKYSVLTDEKTHSKINVAADLLFPDLAVLDGKYCLGLPISVARNTALDALSHCIEGILSKNASSISDLFAKEGIRIISSKFSVLMDGKISAEDYEQLLYASTLAGFVIAQTGTCAVHAAGYALTSDKNIDHGRANALLLVDVLRRFPSDKTAKLYEIMGLSAAHFALIISELLGKRDSITADEIRLFAEKTMLAKNIANGVFAPSIDEVREIYRNSLEVI
jgi:alcohol dehydrogenase class IV